MKASRCFLLLGAIAISCEAAEQFKVCASDDDTLGCCVASSGGCCVFPNQDWATVCIDNEPCFGAKPQCCPQSSWKLNFTSTSKEDDFPYLQMYSCPFANASAPGHFFTLGRVNGGKGGDPSREVTWAAIFVRVLRGRTHAGRQYARR